MKLCCCRRNVNEPLQHLHAVMTTAFLVSLIIGVTNAADHVQQTEVFVQKRHLEDLYPPYSLFTLRRQQHNFLNILMLSIIVITNEYSSNGNGILKT